MAGFLTDAWLDDLEAAARGARGAPRPRRSCCSRSCRTDRTGREVAYALVVGDGRVRVERGRVADPDLTFTQDRATAEAIHRGELSAQAAFMQGRLRLGGDLRAVIDRAGELAAIDDVFASVRA